MFRKSSKSAIDCWLTAMKVKDCKFGRCGGVVCRQIETSYFTHTN